MSKVRESFEEWWSQRGHRWYPSTLKEGVWVAFADAWHRSEKAAKPEPVVTSKNDPGWSVIQSMNVASAAAEGHEPNSPLSHYYRTSAGDVFPYPHGYTTQEWNEKIAIPSYERASDLPSD